MGNGLAAGCQLFYRKICRYFYSVEISLVLSLNKMISVLFMYRIVRNNWDTQRIGTRLKIVKIIILADPKNWTILRKRQNIRNFSDPKNWDGVFGAPK